MSYDEQAIIASCRAEKMENFGLLYDAYIRKIYDFIYYKTLHQETAEDLTSQTFIKALEKIKQFDSSRGSFSAWLYTIAKNNVRDYYRSGREEVNLEDVYDLAAVDNPEIDSHNRLIFEKVKGYLSSLKSAEREIIMLKLWEGRSHKEIAEIMGLSEANSKMILSRTMVKLRRELALIIIYLTVIFTQQI